MNFIPKPIDASAHAVGAFYDRYPFPSDSLKEGPPPGFNWRWSVEMVYAACTGAVLPSQGGAGNLRILDAGCGTGVSTDYLAYLNPGAEILAIDISSGALEIASNRLHLSGGFNQAKIRLENRSLFDLEDEGLFDFINSVGVVHHLEDPVEGLKALKLNLKPGAILHLCLYAEGGRMDIKRIQQAFKTLGLDQGEGGLALGRRLLNELPEKNILRRNYELIWSKQCPTDIDFADMFLHPKETDFTLERLFNLFDLANLEFVGFSNPYVWDLKRLLDGDLLEEASSLPVFKQWQLIESLDPGIRHFEFFLSNGDLAFSSWVKDENILAAKGKPSDYLWDWSGKKLDDSDMNRFRISSKALTLLKVIEEHPDTSLGLLPLDWDKALVASTARDLQQKQLLLLYPL